MFVLVIVVRFCCDASTGVSGVLRDAGWLPIVCIVYGCPVLGVVV